MGFSWTINMHFDHPLGPIASIRIISYTFVVPFLITYRILLVLNMLA